MQFLRDPVQVEDATTLGQVKQVQPPFARGLVRKEASPLCGSAGLGCSCRAVCVSDVTLPILPGRLTLLAQRQ